MWKCLKTVLFLLARLHWLQKVVRLCVSLCENDPTSHLIFHLREQFPNEWTVSIVSLRSSSTQRDVHLVNYGPVSSKRNEVCFRCRYLFMNGELSPGSQSNQDNLSSSTLSHPNVVTPGPSKPKMGDEHNAKLKAARVLKWSPSSVSTQLCFVSLVASRWRKEPWPSTDRKPLHEGCQSIYR